MYDQALRKIIIDAQFRRQHSTKKIVQSINMIAIYSLLLLFCGQSLANTRMKQSTVDGILKNLTALVNSTEKDGVKFLVPGIVRLVFHDCVDGCDACLNFDLISNRGLKKIVDALEPTYENYKSILSRADLWALASKAAIQIAIENNNNRCSDQSCKTPQINIRFRYGRKDCPTSPSHEENTFIPSPLQNSSVLMPWFKDTFNFKPNQVVAIMGMHTKFPILIIVGFKNILIPNYLEYLTKNIFWRN
ncbi:E1.11.1.7 [Lepeophtheirus salmonis]|uniref:E1.11.1.7 n=1 Tax=Lepeophtheirus salmonis TaxID=72036 RepID=A0A7R8CKI9_LEPSM|nr:E1.11.1.7 [Lepeophtheirus salmonis]CAF2846000.1 E1.11.1.7 [Lepeophtheirus salmonis]